MRIANAILTKPYQPIEKKVFSNRHLFIVALASSKLKSIAGTLTAEMTAPVVGTIEPIEVVSDIVPTVRMTLTYKGTRLCSKEYPENPENGDYYMFVTDDGTRMLPVMDMQSCNMGDLSIFIEGEWDLVEVGRDPRRHYSPS